MVKKKIMMSLMFGACAACATAASYTRTDKGVTVKLPATATGIQNFGTAPKLVRLQVVDDRIVRVSATAEDSFRDNRSLVVIEPASQCPYKVS